ncbi:MAG: glycosyltransferase [Kiritimatiellia bacterium]
MRTIPIIHCFDHNYILPAGVCFQSLLATANPDTFYALHVIGTALTDEDKETLLTIVRKFPNASLEFIEAPALDLPGGGEISSGNLSKDVFYKMLIPELFPQYDVAIVTDVDVVYKNDIATAFDYLSADDDAYFCGTEDIGYSVWHNKGILRELGAPKFFVRYNRLFSSEERAALKVGAGFCLFNCKRMRENNIPQRCLEFARKNFSRLLLLEQDVLNIVCASKVKTMPSRFMAIAYYDKYYQELTAEQRAKNPAWDEMFSDPVQIHYASGIKPWKYPASPLADPWFKALFDSGLFDRWRLWFDHYLHPYEEVKKTRDLFEFSVPFTWKPLRRLIVNFSKDTYEEHDRDTVQE